VKFLAQPKVKVIFLPLVEKYSLKCFSTVWRKATITFGVAKNFIHFCGFHPLKADFTRNAVSDIIANAKRLQNV